MDRFLKCKSKTPRDEEYVNAYLKTHSQTKAAQICGVSRETIARAVRRAEIRLDGQKYNNTNHQTKITNEELVLLSETLTTREIAEKYSINHENVQRRFRNLGLNKIQGIGSSKGHYTKRTADFSSENYDSSIDLYRVYIKFNGICQICGKPVDAKDVKGKKVGKLYPSIDHIIPVSKGGSHTWDNVQLAHIICNDKKGDSITVKREGVWT